MQQPFWDPLLETPRASAFPQNPREDFAGRAAESRALEGCLLALTLVTGIGTGFIFGSLSSAGIAAAAAIAGFGLLHWIAAARFGWRRLSFRRFFGVFCDVFCTLDFVLDVLTIFA